MAHPLQPDGTAIARARYRVRLFIRVVILTLFILAAASALPTFLSMVTAIVGSSGSSSSNSMMQGGYGFSVVDMYMMSGGRGGAVPWGIVIDSDELLNAIIMAYGIPATYALLALALIMYTRRIVNWLAPIPGLVCPQCSYELGQGTERSRCPECGLDFAPAAPAA